MRNACRTVKGVLVCLGHAPLRSSRCSWRAPRCRVIYLEDNDIVHMKGGEYTVFNWSDVDSPSVEVRRTIQTLTMEVSQIMKVRGVGGQMRRADVQLALRARCARYCCLPAHAT